MTPAIAALALFLVVPALEPAPVPLLGGRLSVRLPAGAKIEVSSHGIMGAPEAQEDQTQIEIKRGDLRLGLLAEELYALAGTDLEAGIRAHLIATKEPRVNAYMNSLIRLKRVAPPARAVGMEPPTEDAKGEAILIYVAYVAHPDGTVQLLRWYMNPVGRKHEAVWMLLGMKMVESVVPGSRALATQARQDHFDGLVLTLPPGFASSTQEGPDFSVHRIHRLLPLGAPSQACGIYLGHAPDYHHKQSRIPELQVAKRAGKLLGEPVEWHSWAADDRATVEAIAPRQRERVHAFCTAGTVAEAEKLRGVLDSLQVDKPAPR